MSQKTAFSILKDFGLTSKEAEVYLFLAKYEVLTGGEIAKHTKIARSLVYRILKSLQSKSLVETTLESPIRFIALPLEKTIDLIIRTKQEEVIQVQKAKKNLLEDWKVINQSKLELKHEKFVVIENNKKIFSKIQQMIKETKNVISGIVTLSTLARIEQNGILETLPNNVHSKFQLVTNLDLQNLKIIKRLLQNINSKIDLKAKLDFSKLDAFPRFFLRDDEDILFFIRSETDVSTQKDEVCIYTNYKSLVQTFKGIFQDYWKSSTEIEKGISNIEKDSKLAHNSLKEKKVAQLQPKSIEEKNQLISLENEDTSRELSKTYVGNINLLTEEERDILDCASVIGEEFSIDLLEQVSGFTRIRLLKKLNNIERKHNFVQYKANSYEFSNSNIRNILYENLPANLRREYHSLIAKKLEETHQDNLDKISKELAQHYYFSRNAQKGIPTLLKEAEKVWTPKITENQVDEAIKFYSQIIDLADNNQEWEKQKINAFEKLGDIHSIMMQHQEANNFYKKAIDSTDNAALADKINRKIQKTKTIEKHGMKLSYFVYGEGEQIIFYMGNAILSMPQIHFFSQKFKVVLMDLPETLTQRTSNNEYSLESYLEIMNTIIEDLKTDDIFLVSASLGGVLSIHYIVRHPEKIKKLVLIATPSKPAYVDQPERKKQLDDFWAQAFQSPSWGWKKYREMVWKAAPYSGIKRKTERKTSIYDQIRDKTIDPKMMLIYYKILLEADVRQIVDKIRIPTLIIEGEKELHIIPLSHLKFLNKKISGSKLKIVENAELITYTETEKVNKIFEEFFASSTSKN